MAVNGLSSSLYPSGSASGSSIRHPQPRFEGWLWSRKKKVTPELPKEDVFVPLLSLAAKDKPSDTLVWLLEEALPLARRGDLLEAVSAYTKVRNLLNCHSGKLDSLLEWLKSHNRQMAADATGEALENPFNEMVTKGLVDEKSGGRGLPCPGCKKPVLSQSGVAALTEFQSWRKENGQF